MRSGRTSGSRPGSRRRSRGALGCRRPTSWRRTGGCGRPSTARAAAASCSRCPSSPPDDGATMNDPLASAFARLSPTTLCDVLTRDRVMDIGIRPLWPGMPRVAGPAYPVRCPPGDNLMLHAAIYRAAPGAVIVAEGGDTAYALAGGNVCADAQKRGIAALILDGAIRDLAATRARGRPGQGRAGGGREPGGVGEGAPRPRRGDPPAEGAHGLKAIAPEMSRAIFRLTHPGRAPPRATPRLGSRGAEPNRRRPTSSPAAFRYTTSSLTRSYSGIAGSVHRRAKYW